MKYLKALFMLTTILALALVSIGGASATLTLGEWCDFCTDYCDDEGCCDICGEGTYALTYTPGDYEYVVGVDPIEGQHYRDYSFQTLRERMYRPFTWVAVPTGDCALAAYGCEMPVKMPSLGVNDVNRNTYSDNVQRINVQVPPQGDFDTYRQPISGYGMDDKPIDMSGRELRTAPQVGRVYYGEDMKSNFFTKSWLVVLYLIIAFIVLILIVIAIFKYLLRA